MSGKAVLAIVAAAAPPSQDEGTMSPVGLMGEAAAVAIGNAGINKHDIDGLFSASAFYYMPTLTLGEYLGITPRYSDTTTIGGCSFVAHLNHAAAAIATGDMAIGLIAYGSTQRSVGSRFVKTNVRAAALRGALRAPLADLGIRDAGCTAHARVRHHLRAAR